MVCICLFHICSREVPISIFLNYDERIIFFLKEVLYLLNKIYRYMYVEDHAVEVAPLHTQSASSFRKKCSSCGGLREKRIRFERERERESLVEAGA